MAAQKRPEPLDRARDVQHLLDLCLAGGLPKTEIYRRVNLDREERAYRRARAGGLSEEESRKVGREARVSVQTFRADLRMAKARLEELRNDKARSLIVQRLAEIEVEREALRAMEERCWDELNRSGRERLVSGARRTTTSAEGDPQTMTLERSDPIRSADPRWMAQIESLIWKRYQMGFEVLRLKALIGEEVPTELSKLVELAAEGQREAIGRLQGQELGLLYGFEARAAGTADPAITKARVQILSGFRSKGDLPPSGGTGAGNGAGHFTFEVVGLEVEES